MIGRRRRGPVDQELADLDGLIRQARQAQLDAGTTEARVRALEELNQLLDRRLELMRRCP